MDDAWVFLIFIFEKKINVEVWNPRLPVQGRARFRGTTKTSAKPSRDGGDRDSCVPHTCQTGFRKSPNHPRIEVEIRLSW